jgi:cephalosporin-C deacetylase
MTDQITPASCTVRIPRESAVYDVGERVDFHVEAGPDAPAALDYNLTWDGVMPIRRDTVSLAEGKGIVSISPDKPGIVRLTVRSNPAAQAAAAVAPERIEPSLPVPDDFDKVWSDHLAAQQNTPVSCERVPHREHAGGTVHAVTVPVLNAGTIHGWLHMPHGEGPFPALVRYHGAGVYRLPYEHSIEWAERGVMALSINSHPIRNDRPEEFYTGLREGELSDYRNRPQAFVEMFCRAARAMDFVRSMPEWDNEHLIAAGHSQGGGQALAAAALNSGVSGLVLSCPTHCDHTAKPAGWPQILTERSDPELTARVRYIDGVNFASRITCPALFGVCLLDSTCPPTGVFATANAVSGPKSFHYEPYTAHIYTDAFDEVSDRWVAEHIKA